MAARNFIMDAEMLFLSGFLQSGQKMASDVLGQKSFRAYIMVYIMFLFASEIRTQDVNSIRAICQVHKGVIVDVDPEHHNLYPHLVKLPRCGGSIQLTSPAIKRCAPLTSYKVAYEFHTLPFFQKQRVYLDHHTSCTGECVKSASSCNQFQNWDNQNCQCNCKHITAPTPSPCNPPSVWGQSNCNCICLNRPAQCPENKEWNEEGCLCTCKKRYLNRCAKKLKVVNQENCKCMEPPLNNATAAGRGDFAKFEGVPNNILIMIVVIEFLSLTFIFFLIYRCCLKELHDTEVDTSTLRKRVRYEVNSTLQRMKIKKRKGATREQQDFLQERPTVEQKDENSDAGFRDVQSDFHDDIQNGHPDEEQKQMDKYRPSEYNEEPVGFYYDAYSSDANVSLDPEPQVTAV